MADDIVDRLTFMEPTADDWQDVTDQAADEIERLRAEIVRLTAEVERIEGQQKLRADMAYLFKAERDDERRLADQLAAALFAVKHDRPSVHTDNVWAVINHALITYEEVRRER